MNEAIARAHNEALKSVETFRLGAAVVRRNAVVACGRNRNANSCGLSSIHAEMDAVFRCPGPAKHAHVVVVRVLRDGSTTAMSKPCAACWKALARLGVRKVTFSTGDPRRPFVTLGLDSCSAKVAGSARSDQKQVGRNAFLERQC